MLQLRIVDVADANVVSALLNGRIALDLFNPLLSIPAAEPFVRGNAPHHVDLIRSTAMYLD